jgi:hypothetical protein
MANWTIFVSGLASVAVMGLWTFLSKPQRVDLGLGGS